MGTLYYGDNLDILRPHLKDEPVDLVHLDPFCGCGTTIDAAERLGRDWIGIDVTQLAISLIKNRLQNTCGSRLRFVSGSDQSSAGVPPAQSAKADANAAGTATLPSLVRIIGEPTTPGEPDTLAQ